MDEIFSDILPKTSDVLLGLNEAASTSEDYTHTAICFIAIAHVYDLKEKQTQNDLYWQKNYFGFAIDTLNKVVEKNDHHHRLLGKCYAKLFELNPLLNIQTMSTAELRENAMLMLNNINDKNEEDLQLIRNLKGDLAEIALPVDVQVIPQAQEGELTTSTSSSGKPTFFPPPLVRRSAELKLNVAGGKRLKT